MDAILCLPRPVDPVLGSSTVLGMARDDRHVRQARLLELMLAGHVPDRLRRLAPVEFDADDSVGRRHHVVLYVARDYLSLGTDGDSVRVPLDAPGAQRAADTLGCLLPTTLIVDRIWAAGLRLPPLPWGPPYDATMMSAERAATHSARVDAQLAAQNIDRSGLLAGHKKDVVLTNRLMTRAAYVAIYGWHRVDGRPIQPLSTVHEASYADYSHGTRLVHRLCLVDGKESELSAIMADPVLSALVSVDRPLRVTRYPGT